MKALVLTSKEDGIIFNADYPTPIAQIGEVRIKVLAAALNHRDVWITQGQYAGIKYPTVLGSDGVGVVESVGEGVSSELIGQTVIINPNNQWGDNQRHQSKQYHILGLPKDGTLAEFVTVDANKIRLAPPTSKHRTSCCITFGRINGLSSLVWSSAITSRRKSVN
jgi:zinc-binding alcohol dehydrogenase/oxidoreductase